MTEFFSLWKAFHMKLFNKTNMVFLKKKIYFYSEISLALFYVNFFLRKILFLEILYSKKQNKHTNIFFLLNFIEIEKVLLPYT